MLPQVLSLSRTLKHGRKVTTALSVVSFKHSQFVTVPGCFFPGNLSPYLTSYIRKHSSPDLQYTDSVWIFAVTGMGQGTSMYFGGVLERRFGPRITVIIGAWFMRLALMDDIKKNNFQIL